MGTRYFDSENRIEHKNQTKRSANKRRMIQFWYLTGLSVVPINIKNLMFDGWDGWDGLDGLDGNQKCPLIFFILRYIKH